MNNKNAIELQAQIQSLSFQMMNTDDNKNLIRMERKYERLNREYESALKILPMEGKQITQNGNLIPWESK